MHHLVLAPNYTAYYNGYDNYKNRLKAWKTDYASYIDSGVYYWLSSYYSNPYYYLVKNSTGGASYSETNYIYGVRPLVCIFPDFDKYTTVGAGTFVNPYKFILKETVTNTLDEGTYTESQEFELDFSDGATIYFQIDNGETQTYDPVETYTISKSCTLTAWAQV